MSGSIDTIDPSLPASPGPRRSRLRRWLPNLALMAGSFLLCFAALELVLRLAGYGNLEIYVPERMVYWRLKPNQNCFTKIDRKPVRVNSHGVRGSEFPLRTPPGTVRILSLGDSRTFGWGVAEDESYSGRLQILLRKFYGQRLNVEVINAGVNGYSYPQMHYFLRDRGLKFQPDFVLVGGGNLSTQFSDANDAKFVKSFMNRVRLKNFLRRFATYHSIVEVKLRKFYETQRARFIPIDPKNDPILLEQQQGDPEAFFRKQIEAICVLARTNGLRVELLFQPTLDQLNAAEPPNLLKAYTQVSQQHQALLVDISADLRARGGGKELYLDADPVHFSVPGNEIIARQLFTTFTNLIVVP